MKKGDLVKLHNTGSIVMMTDEYYGIVLESRIQELYSQVRVDKDNASFLVNPFIFKKHKPGDIIEYNHGTYLIVDVTMSSVVCLRLTNPNRGDLKRIPLTEVFPRYDYHVSVSNKLVPGRKVQYKGSEYTVVHDPEYTIGENEVMVIDKNFQIHVLPTKDLNI